MKRFILFTLLSIYLISCSSDNSTEPTKEMPMKSKEMPDFIMPLSHGNTWTYRQGDDLNNTEFTLTLIDTTDANFGGEIYKTFYLKSDKIVGVQYRPGVIDWRLFAKKGDTLLMTIFSTSNPGEIHKRYLTEESITDWASYTPDGTITNRTVNGIKYDVLYAWKLELEEIDEMYYFAKGYGLVLYEDVNKKGEILKQTILVKSKIK